MSKLIRSATAAAALFGLAASADAAVIAGWDFSQYETGGGALAVDGNSTLANTLFANYSNLDPTGNAGAESAQYGQMYVNGQFGSTNVTSAFSGALLPIAGSLSSNTTAIGPNPFNSLSVLTFEGQTFAEDLRMKTFAPSTSVVFAADAGAGKTVSGWSLSFATQLEGVTSGQVVVEFSSDGTSFASIGSPLAITATDAQQVVSLGAGSNQRAFVRLTFTNGATFDNVALSGVISNVVPEPMTASLLAAGLGGLALLGRRRRA